MSVLWMKFPDEVVLDKQFEAAEKKKFEEIFSLSDTHSAWSKALDVMGLKNSDKAGKLIFWYEDIPYFNWSYMVRTVSGGAMSVEQNGDQYGVKIRYNRLWSLISSQWKIAKFIERKQVIENKFVESIALGIALQSLIMRLGAQAADMALWLSSPKLAPAKHRRTIKQIQSIQLQRTHISHIWQELFPAGNEAVEKDLPEFFWGDQIPVIKETIQSKTAREIQERWKGLAVCAGQKTGMAVAVPAKMDVERIIQLKQKNNAPLILVFRRARPETTELFQYADAVLYAEGGVLSHACTITREMNLPCVTNLGVDFFTFVSGHDCIWLKMDGESGIVEPLQV